MKINRSVSSSIVLLLILLASAAFPSAVLAISVTGVSPSSIVNDADRTITVSGTDFVSGAVVRVGGTDLATTFLTATSLEAVVPAGFPAGSYAVEAINPDLSSASLPGALTVQAPTPTPTPSPTPPPFGRPQVVIEGYSINTDGVRSGQQFNLSVRLDNAGSKDAYGIQVAFASTDLLMLQTGGVLAGGNLGVVGNVNLVQPMTAAVPLFGMSTVSVEMNLAYYDESGTPFTDRFLIILPVYQVRYTGGSGSSATATPTGLRRSQLVIVDYSTDVDPLQPGDMFQLDLSIQNVGNVNAKNITMIVGGGSAGGSGTPQAGISGGSGEFTNFAPIGTSNVQSLGEIGAGMRMEASQRLVVNVSTNPGAYPFRITFSYQDERGNLVNDEQVITLLVYRLPNVDVSFYQPVGMLMTGQPNPLPLQVVNLGRYSFILGKMKVEASNGTIENGEMLVGPLDPGGYFTLDALVYPETSGPLDLIITIEYRDDFNQARTLTSTLTVDVEEMILEPTPDPSFPVDGGEVVIGPETFWQKVWRFLLGLFGLDSSAPSQNLNPAEPFTEPLPVGPTVKG